jgi:hypothetical protein
VERNPFDVLNLQVSDSLDTARASYKVLARKHHPDTAPESGRATATRLMAEINWAMDELERDLAGWRRLAGGAAVGLLYFEEEPEVTTITVEPQLVILNMANGFSSWVTAAAKGVASRDLKPRYESGLIRLERAHSVSGVANFLVRLAPGVDQLAQEQSETVEITAPVADAVSVRVAVAPFTAEQAAQLRQAQREPFKYPWELVVAGASFLGALAIVLLVA